VPRIQERVTIALLPLEGVDLVEADAWYAEGVTDSLMTDLVKIHGLRVISQSSAKLFKPTDDVTEVGKKLGVDYLATGTVSKSGEVVKLSVKLTRVRDVEQVWKREYAQAAGQALGTQGEPARAISRAAGVRVSAEEAARLAQGREVSPEAYDLLLKGKVLGWTGDPADTVKGIAYLEAAVRLEPEWATGWATLATVENYSTQQLKDPDLFRKAEEAAQRALQLDQNNADVQIMLGDRALVRDYNWVEAESRYKTVLNSNPNNFYALAQLSGVFLFGFKRFDEATKYTEEMLRVDPANSAAISQAGINYYYMRNYEEAVALAEEALRMEPDNSLAVRNMGLYEVEMKRYDEAIAWTKKAVEMQAWGGEAVLGYVYGKSGDRQHAEAVAAKLLKEYKGLGSEPADIALVYCGLGQVDEAIRFLEEQYRLDKSVLWDLAVGPWCDTLRSDPRFKALLKKMNLPE
jgi:TolB-like protein/Tfp pilus assembly protein PilF